MVWASHKFPISVGRGGLLAGRGVSWVGGELGTEGGGEARATLLLMSADGPPRERAGVGGGGATGPSPTF